MKAARRLLSWTGLDASDAAVFGLGLGFAVSYENGRLSDCLPEHLIIMNTARTLGIICEEFGTVSREKALQYLKEHLGRETPVAVRFKGEMIALTGIEGAGAASGESIIPWEDIEEGIFQGEGPFKAYLYTYKKTKHIPPLGIAGRKALSEIARRFLFPDKPGRGIKASGMLRGDEKPLWAHEPAIGHKLLADFLEEMGRPESAHFRGIAEKLPSASEKEAGALISEERGIFSGLL